jgi:hypothetical protein
MHAGDESSTDNVMSALDSDNEEDLDDDSSTDDAMRASDSDEEENLDELYERANQGQSVLDENGRLLY